MLKSLYINQSMFTITSASVVSKWIISARRNSFSSCVTSYVTDQIRYNVFKACLNAVINTILGAVQSCLKSFLLKE